MSRVHNFSGETKTQNAKTRLERRASLSAEAEEFLDLNNHEIPRNRAFCQVETAFPLTGAFVPNLAPFRGGLSDQTEGEAMSFAHKLPNHLRPRREKVFGDGRPRPLDRNAKVRIMTRARALSHRTEKGKHYGLISAKALAVLEALLWGFHNASSGRCFPSYETIAARAKCARSTVAEAIKALEEAGILSWVNRITRIRERMPDLFGQWATRVRIIRISNAYHFCDLKGAAVLSSASKSENPSGTSIQESFLLKEPAAPSLAGLTPELAQIFDRWGKAKGFIK